MFGSADGHKFRYLKILFLVLSPTYIFDFSILNSNSLKIKLTLKNEIRQGSWLSEARQVRRVPSDPKRLWRVQKDRVPAENQLRQQRHNRQTDLERDNPQNLKKIRGFQIREQLFPRAILNTANRRPRRHKFDRKSFGPGFRDSAPRGPALPMRFFPLEI